VDVNGTKIALEVLMFQAKLMVVAMIGEVRLRRLGWLSLLALPVLLAACGQNGSNSGY
jgi:hypothetical protein